MDASVRQFIEKEDNMRIANVLVDFLTTDNVRLHAIDFEDPDISDYNMIPNSVLLSDRLRVCLQESDEVPTDFTRLFNTRLFSISTSLVPPAIKDSHSLSLFDVRLGWHVPCLVSVFRRFNCT